MQFAAALASLFLALAKALPAIERALQLVEEKRRNARAAELHGAIDAAIEKARHATPACPRVDCPVFRLRRGVLDAAAAESDRATPPPS